MDVATLTGILAKSDRFLRSLIESRNFVCCNGALTAFGQAENAARRSWEFFQVAEHEPPTARGVGSMENVRSSGHVKVSWQDDSMGRDA